MVFFNLKKKQQSIKQQQPIKQQPITRTNNVEKSSDKNLESNNVNVEQMIRNNRNTLQDIKLRINKTALKIEKINSIQMKN